MTCGPIPLSSNYNMRIYNVLQIKETRVILICKNFYLVKKFVCKQQHKSRSFSEAVRNFNQARIRANACFRLYRSLRAAYSHVDRTRRKKQKKKKETRTPAFVLGGRAVVLSPISSKMESRLCLCHPNGKHFPEAG